MQSESDHELAILPEPATAAPPAGVDRRAS